ncbi:hypothetical protein ISS42_01580 [Candidatus Shapirobacteria bacterium]|nr:hypothetical protein [Candidatus Shapirobacteria bacterium]
MEEVGEESSPVSEQGSKKDLLRQFIKEHNGAIPFDVFVGESFLSCASP